MCFGTFTSFVISIHVVVDLARKMGNAGGRYVVLSLDVKKYIFRVGVR